jgi:hypothetical protein
VRLLPVIDSSSSSPTTSVMEWRWVPKVGRSGQIVCAHLHLERGRLGAALTT